MVVVRLSTTRFDQVEPSGETSILYPVTAVPPSSSGALHARSTCVCPFAVAVSPVGAPGTVPLGLPVTDADQGPSPASLTALTCMSY